MRIQLNCIILQKKLKPDSLKLVSSVINMSSLLNGKDDPPISKWKIYKPVQCNKKVLERLGETTLIFHDWKYSYDLEIVTLTHITNFPLHHIQHKGVLCVA